MEHHAYLTEGPLSLLPSIEVEARKQFGFKDPHSPDVYVRSFEKVGVEEAAQIRAQAAFKSTAGKALFIIGFSLITSEAQQSLLKLLEEPQEGTIFILVAPHGSLFPTVRSRLLPYTPQHTAPQKVLGSPSPGRPDHFAGQFAASFLKSSQKERSAQIATLLKDEEGERERVRAFLNDLEKILYEAEKMEGLSDIAKVRSYVGDRSPSLKMLLEHLALSLPQL